MGDGFSFDDFVESLGGAKESIGPPNMGQRPGAIPAGFANPTSADSRISPNASDPGLGDLFDNEMFGFDEFPEFATADLHLPAAALAASYGKPPPVSKQISPVSGTHLFAPNAPQQPLLPHTMHTPMPASNTPFSDSIDPPAPGRRPDPVSMGDPVINIVAPEGIDEPVQFHNEAFPMYNADGKPVADGKVSEFHHPVKHEIDNSLLRHASLTSLSSNPGSTTPYGTPNGSPFMMPGTPNMGGSPSPEFSPDLSPLMPLIQDGFKSPYDPHFDPFGEEAMSPFIEDDSKTFYDTSQEEQYGRSQSQQLSVQHIQQHIQQQRLQQQQQHFQPAQNLQPGQNLHQDQQISQHLSPQIAQKQHLSPQSSQHLSSQSSQHLSRQSSQHLSPQISQQHLSPQISPQHFSPQSSHHHHHVSQQQPHLPQNLLSANSSHQLPQQQLVHQYHRNSQRSNQLSSRQHSPAAASYAPIPHTSSQTSLAVPRRKSRTLSESWGSQERAAFLESLEAQTKLKQEHDLDDLQQLLAQRNGGGGMMETDSQLKFPSYTPINIVGQSSANRLSTEEFRGESGGSGDSSLSSSPSNLLGVPLQATRTRSLSSPYEPTNDLKAAQMFSCELCSKRFTRAYNLRSHMRTHTDERPFACQHCGKAFARQHDRKRHEALHSGQKRFACLGLSHGFRWGCQKRFARADALGRHFRTEAGKNCLRPLIDQIYANGTNKKRAPEGILFAGIVNNQPQLTFAVPERDTVTGMTSEEREEQTRRTVIITAVAEQLQDFMREKTNKSQANSNQTDHETQVN